MGGKNWQRLHRLIYVAAIAAIIHFWWLVKPGVRTPWRVTAILDPPAPCPHRLHRPQTPPSPRPRSCTRAHPPVSRSISAFRQRPKPHEGPAPMSPIDRRKFAAGILASSLHGASAQPPSSPAPTRPEHFLLKPNGWIPNNPQLPVLLYRAALPQPAGEPLATAMEQVFTANGWPPQWRNGIYTFHHFHSTAHEILGIAAGEVQVLLGGPVTGPTTGQTSTGRDLTLSAGDVVALPAGTGHCKLRSTPDLLVIGAYPTGQHWDICRTALSPAALEAMRHIAFPQSDPVQGPNGPLQTLWPSSWPLEKPRRES